MFSRRTTWGREPTALSQALGARHATGKPILDLTASNPTRCGFRYEAEALLSPLADTHSLVYTPEPLGQPAAREAVCAYSREHGAAVQSSQLCLTSSTSEAYSFLFRLLCDPDDEVLIAQPGYPLFDFLADLDDVRLVPYPLFYDHGWQVEPGAIRARITPRTRAIVLVHPNNPTGHFVSAGERAELEQLCVEHELALIVDEVFLDYPLSAEAASKTFAAGPHPALTFVLSGLSKVAALPQMKASWMVAAGPEAQAAEAMARLELIADAFLSMSAPVQQALPAWLGSRPVLQQQISARTRNNLAQLDALLANDGLASRLAVEGGWYAIVRVPALGSDDALVIELILNHGVLVHPGHYYGFAQDGMLVVSLLTPAEDFRLGIAVLLTCSADRVARFA